MSKSFVKFLGVVRCCGCCVPAHRVMTAYGPRPPSGSVHGNIMVGGVFILAPSSLNKRE